MLQKNVKKHESPTDNKGKEKQRSVSGKRNQDKKQRADNNKRIREERAQQLVGVKDVSKLVSVDEGGIEDIKKVEEVMGFEVNGEFYCVPLGYVGEVITLEPISAPDLPSFIVGISEYRGDVLPVIDLGILFGTGKVGSNDSSCIILNLEGTPVAMKLSRIIGIIKIKGKHIYTLPDELEVDYLKGAIEYNNKVMAIIDPIRLLQSKRVAETKE